MFFLPKFVVCVDFFFLTVFWPNGAQGSQGNTKTIENKDAARHIFKVLTSTGELVQALL